MAPRRQLSLRAKQKSIKLKEDSKKAVVSCWGDFINLRLVPLKISFFLIMGATQCVGPYMTLLLKAVGLTKIETALVYSISPLIPILSPIIAGCIADKMGNFRVLLVVSVVLSAFSSLIFICIPPARTTPNYSSHVDFDLTCGDKNFLLSPNLKDNDCDFLDDPIKSISVKAKDCGYTCPDGVFKYPKSLKKKLKDTALKIHHNSTLYHVCEFKSKSNDGHHKCVRFNANESYSDENMPNSFSLHDARLDVQLFNQNISVIEVVDPKMSNLDTKAHCPNGSVPKVINVPIITLSSNKTSLKSFDNYFQDTECVYHCQVSLPHNKTCKDQPNTIEHNVLLTLGLYIGGKLIMKFLIGFSYTLFEIASLAILKEYGNNYGLQRVYGSVGGMIFAPLTGFCIDLLGNNHYSDYIIAFVMYCAIKLICASILMKIDLKFRRRGKSVQRNICKLFLEPECILLILMVFISGICYGFIENFLSWHLHDLGATDLFIGFLTTIASGAALPFLVLSDPICKMFGHVQAMVFGLICYGIRCIGYSMIKDPWWAIPFEFLEGVTTGLLVASAIIYGTKISSKTNLATLQGILAMTHYGLGKSGGSILGGYLMSVIGTEKTFLIFSGIAFGFGFIYYVILKLFLQPRQNRIQKYKDDVMNMPVKIVPRPSMSEDELRHVFRQNDLSSLTQIQVTNPKYTSTPRKSSIKKKTPAPTKKLNIDVNNSNNDTTVTLLSEYDKTKDSKDNFTDVNNRDQSDINLELHEKKNCTTDNSQPAATIDIKEEVKTLSNEELNNYSTDRENKDDDNYKDECKDESNVQNSQIVNPNINENKSCKSIDSLELNQISEDNQNNSPTLGSNEQSHISIDDESQVPNLIISVEVANPVNEASNLSDDKTDLDGAEIETLLVNGSEEKESTKGDITKKGI